MLLNKGRVNKEVLKRIIIPMDIARYYEIPRTFEYLKVNKNSKVFDLSSPKLISCYLSEVTKAKVVATDVWRDEILSWSIFKKTNTGKNIFKNLILKVIDGRHLKFKSNYFDFVYSISVIEHIEKNGDSKMIKELARILKRGGVLVLTTPVGNKYEEKWVNRDVYGTKYSGKKSVFLSRIYSRKKLQERLIIPSGLTLEKMEICQETFPIFSLLYTKFLPVSALFGLMFPIFALISLNVGNVVGDKNNVLLVLRKIK